MLLVTHGLAMRLFCMRWFHWTVAEFESLSNPGNGEIRMLVLGGRREVHAGPPVRPLARSATVRDHWIE
ncbi:hypothetical protein GCM10020295_21010 [Streptomyces cinereospinus]